MTGVLSAMDVLVSASADETFGMAVVEALGNGLPVTFVECPALDDLSSMPAHARRVPRSGDDETDADALRLGLLHGLAQGRRPVPAELSERYGADAAARRVEQIHRVLHERRTGQLSGDTSGDRAGDGDDGLSRRPGRGALWLKHSRPSIISGALRSAPRRRGRATALAGVLITLLVGLLSACGPAPRARSCSGRARR